MYNVEESINRGKAFADFIKKKKEKSEEISRYVIPRNVTQEEFQAAVERFHIANNQLLNSNIEDFDTGCMKLALAEAELNKLFKAAKLYQETA